MKQLKDFLRTLTLKDEPIDKLADFLRTLSDDELIEIYNTDLKQRGLTKNVIHKIYDNKYLVREFGSTEYRTFSKLGDWHCPIVVRELAERILMSLSSFYFYDD